MALKAVFAARLLSGEMPQNIEEAFSSSGICLFPKKKDDLVTDCSCPDWSNPCKHIAAVYYLLAEQFDCDPFLIFKLRGRTKEQIIEALRNMRASGAQMEPEESPGMASSPADPAKLLEECLDSYWHKGRELDQLEINPNAPDVQNAVLKRLGDSPFSIGDENMATLLSKAYLIAGREARRKALGEAENKGHQ
jgi:uncharacterized Zn finger protein